MAEAELARLTTGRNAELKARGHRSQAALDDARLALAGIEARIDALSAGIDGVDVRIAKSEIHAPFDGEVGARNADPGRTVAAGEPVLTLLETGAPRLRVGLPAESASALTPGDAVEVLAGGVAWRARVERVRPDLEAVTRTRAVIVALDPAGAGAPAFGDTGTLVLRTRVEEPGFWAPLAALSEGARGAWTVMALDGAGPDARAIPAPVEVIHAEADRVYVRGALPAGARIIAAGPERIVAGQSVLALAE
jgi:RND family efflux transporter MFP subunit